jgi:hypothetical protein
MTANPKSQGLKLGIRGAAPMNDTASQRRKYSRNLEQYKPILPDH